MIKRALLLASLLSVVGCGATPDAPSDRPLYQRDASQVDAYLRTLSRQQPDLRRRVVDIARKNKGQPYELYLLGEAPFERRDDQPVYCLEKSDCVVFTEHTLAMALSDDFPGFLRMLQRIRYNGGHVGVLTRNHYTEADWNVNNRWLAADISAEIAGGHAKRFKSTVNRKSFFANRYHLNTPFPNQKIEETYVPYERIDEVKSKLQSGDIVEFVKGPADDSAWVHHMGLVAVMPDGAVHLIHSTPPRVREEPIEAYIARNTKDNEKNDRNKKARHRGFKFLRLADDPIANLRAVDGAAAPIVILPPDSPTTWEAFVKAAMKR